MTDSYHGLPCWFELGTSDLDAAGAFYGKLFGWQVADSGMEGFDYRLARGSDGPSDMVAGMMALDAQPPGTPPNWLIYFCVDSADDTAAKIAGKGGKVVSPPADIPGTGRYAVVADPQGAVFGILQPDMTEADREMVEAGRGAFDQKRAGHGNWVELMNPDPAAALSFYGELFGWTKGETMPMGEMGDYQLVRYRGTDIGAIMGLGNAPVPAWLPYFGVDGSVGAAIETVKAAGGQVHHGPAEVPGPAWIAVMQDPQGAWFAVVGPQQ